MNEESETVDSIGGDDGYFSRVDFDQSEATTFSLSLSLSIYISSMSNFYVRSRLMGIVDFSPVET